MIVWRDEMSIGVDTLDDDHKKLFNIINEFEVSKNRKSAEITAKKLFTYTQEHFKREEEIQSESLYPHRHDQKHDHANIIKDLKHLIKNAFIESSASDEEVIAKLSQLMHEWIVGHVIQSDMKMREFFKSPKSK